MRLLLYMTAMLSAMAMSAQNWQLIWADEFDGGALDANNWNYDLGTGSQYGLGGWGNNELQYYTDRTENVSVGSGQLTITARQENYQGQAYTSGKIHTKTKFNTRYGKIEARMQVPTDQGMWPAFWMLTDPNDLSQNTEVWPPEIDIFESVGYQPSTAYGTLHVGDYPNVQSHGGSRTLSGETLSDDFHTYAIEWYPDNIIWYMDGVEFYRVDRAGLSPGAWLREDLDYYLILNLAVGGNWPGSPDASTQFPAQMLVDYVRVYDYDETTTTPVTFRVDMSQESLSAGDVVYLNGTFNSWCGACTPLTNEGGGVWSTTLDLAPGVYEYKYTTQGWAGLVESFEAGAPCALTTYDGDNVYVNRAVNVGFDPMTLDPLCFSTCDYCPTASTGCTDPSAVNYDPAAVGDDGSCAYEVDFYLDMSQVGFAYTTPEINGTFNGWCGACNSMTDADGDDVWEATVILQSGQQEFKFAYDAWAGQEDLTGAGPCTLTTGEFTNRVLDVTGNMSYGPVCWESCEACESDCDVFDTAPVDLTKSFDPVNGIQDRVQVKWYKATPQIKYTDEDAAMCDIRFWAKRDLDPVTGNPVGPVIADPDTITIVDAKKNYGNGDPRQIFKWPVKFRADGVNNNKRVDPNIRYEWQVRCECGHDGNGPESPWSAVKTFNTPDFDPSTGIYTDGTAVQNQWHEEKVKLFPNPNDGQQLTVGMEMDRQSIQSLVVVNSTGRVVEGVSYHWVDGGFQLAFNTELKPGIYRLLIARGSDIVNKSFIVMD